MNACASKLKRALAAHGSWMGRVPLGLVVDFSEARVDDELADLVLAGDVLFNERSREYRLAGTPLARRALRELLAGTTATHLMLAPSADKTTMRGGLALRRVQADGTEALCTLELELPHHQGDPQAVQQMATAFANFGKAVAVPPRPAP